MNKLTYEPIVDNFPLSCTVEELRNLYLKLRPLFAEEERAENEENVIQITEE